VEWDLSNVCSLGCQSCHFAHTHVRGPWVRTDTPKPAGYSQTGQAADFSLVERALVEMRQAGVRAIVWSGGGEPTLHTWFSAILKRAHAQGFEQGLYTLGGHIDNYRADTIRECLSWVVVSLDCPDAETYAAEKNVAPSRFQDACDGVLRLSGGQLVVGVSFLLHAGNWTRTAEMLSLSRSLGATYTTFRPTINTSPANPSVVTEDRSWIAWAGQVLRDLADQPDVEIDLQRFEDYLNWDRGYSACHGVKLLTMVTPDGRVWICPNRRGVAGSELGDLRTESFADIWARHPGQWTDFEGCRVMCRLHSVNQSLAGVLEPKPHEAFV
jgi:MoaA/NifB/PqqE/SkfB family radical SAM enzyme